MSPSIIYLYVMLKTNLLLVWSFISFLLVIPWCLSSPPPLNHDVTALAVSRFSKSLTGKRNPSSIIHRDYGLYCTESTRTIQRPLEPRQSVLRHGQPVWLSVDPDVSTGPIKKWALSYKQNIWEWEETGKNLFFFFFLFSSLVNTFTSTHASHCFVPLMQSYKPGTTGVFIYVVLNAVFVYRLSASILLSYFNRSLLVRRTYNFTNRRESLWCGVFLIPTPPHFLLSFTDVGAHNVLSLFGLLSRLAPTFIDFVGESQQKVVLKLWRPA